MKFLVSTLLVLFIIFLSTPTVVMLIEKSTDISLIYDLSEKENQKETKELKELKTDFTIKNQVVIVSFLPHYSKKIISENVLKHDSISEEIFIPPPELI